jgi:hypothetical protein
MDVSAGGLVRVEAEVLFREGWVEEFRVEGSVEENPRPSNTLRIIFFTKLSQPDCSNQQHAVEISPEISGKTSGTCAIRKNNDSLGRSWGEKLMTTSDAPAWASPQL